MDDAVLARIQQDTCTWNLFYDETTCLLSIQQSTGEQFICECSLFKLVYPSQERLQQIACDALYDALYIALAIDGYTAENDPASLDRFAAWCDEVDVLGNGKTAVQEALMKWRRHWQVWRELETFLTKDCLLSYLKLFFIEDETETGGERR